MAIYSTDILLFLVGTSLFYHVQFWLFLPDLHKDFSRGRSGGLVFPSLSEFSTVCCDSHNQWLWHSKKGRSRCFLELCCFFDDPPDVGNLISGSSDFSKSSLNIWKFLFMYCWSLAWRILSITLLACERNAIVWQFFSCFSSTFAYWVKLVSSFLKQVSLENSKNSLLWMVLQTLTASQATYFFF